MLSFLSFIVDTVNTAIHLVVMLVTSIFNISVLIPRFSTYTAALFAWLPQPFAMFAVLGLSVSIVLFLVGRES